MKTIAATMIAVCTLSLALTLEVRAKARDADYLVVLVGLDPDSADHNTFREVARAIATFHDAETVSFNGEDFEALQNELTQRLPEYVLFVIPPETLDINLHRRILLLSADLDDDIFADFSFGYFTARDGAGLEELWKRTLEVHTNGLQNKTWLDTGVTDGMKSTVYPSHLPDMAKAAGFEGSTIYFSVIESDPDTLAFVSKMLPDLERASVIEMSGNGDPQGIWLFAGARNMDRSKHWAYDPEKVGHDPEGETPRITADRFAALNLKSPVVWSGTCHSAATRIVYVEGDIVSTFGTTPTQTLHMLDPKKSMCLSIIEAGAVAFLAPIGANHGYATLVETEYALQEGAPLGDVLRRTYNDVLLAAEGSLRLDVSEDGEPHIPWNEAEPVMQGGGANRILIGDPALKPFQPAPHPLETVEIKKTAGGGFDVHVTWMAGFHPKAWDMFGTDRERVQRICARVPLDGKAGPFSASITAVDGDGGALSYVMSRVEVEEHHGRHYLHLQANRPRPDDGGRGTVRATFSVKPLTDPR